MSDIQPIVNKVAQSQTLRLLDLESFYPSVEIVGFDIQPYLFGGMILKEKEFRESLKEVDWEEFRSKAVFIHCSADTIIPVWAFMLVTAYLKDIAAYTMLGTFEQLVERLIINNLQEVDYEDFRGKKVLVKGCSDKPVPYSVYVEVARILLPMVNSLMYGEACSNVPVYKMGKIS